MGFGGQFGYYTDDTGRTLLGHRFYDAGMGRFVTRDPIGYKGGINLYGFTGNNPVNESDPSGYGPGNLDEWYSAWDNTSLSDAWDDAKQSIRGNFNLHLAASAAREVYDIYDHVSDKLSGVQFGAAPIATTLLNPPKLPAPSIFRHGNVRITHKYGGGLDSLPGGRSDHLPAHAHVEGGGRETHIGANGKPLKGQPEVTPEQEKAVEAGRSIIRSRINKINRWAKYLKWARKIPME
jgi:RHS repeat-associated protein